MIYALDGLFGLPRKKAAGHSHREPLHGSLWFCNQFEVDEFVGQSQQNKAIKKCNVVYIHYLMIMLLLHIKIFRSVVILWLAVHFEVIADTGLWMRLLCSAVLVDMNFQQSLSI